MIHLSKQENLNRIKYDLIAAYNHLQTIPRNVVICEYGFPTRIVNLAEEIDDETDIEDLAESYWQTEYAWLEELENYTYD